MCEEERRGRGRVRERGGGEVGCVSVGERGREVGEREWPRGSGRGEGEDQGKRCG